MLTISGSNIWGLLLVQLEQFITAHIINVLCMCMQIEGEITTVFYAGKDLSTVTINSVTFIQHEFPRSPGKPRWKTILERRLLIS